MCLFLSSGKMNPAHLPILQDEIRRGIVRKKHTRCKRKGRDVNHLREAACRLYLQDIGADWLFHQRVHGRPGGLE